MLNSSFRSPKVERERGGILHNVNQECDIHLGDPKSNNRVRYRAGVFFLVIVSRVCLVPVGYIMLYDYYGGP